jgi:RNA polymerase sigma factor for flagellar operon FliA
MYLNNVTSTGFPNSDAQAQTTREAIIVQHLTHVHALAKRLRSHVPPCVTLDDLIGAGTIGLIQAVDRFQPSRGLQFATYAKHRIRGAMLDFLREEDPLSRTERRRARESAAGLSATGYGIQPVTVSLDQISLRRLAAPAQDGFTIRSEVREARRSLSQRENRVIALLYDFGWKSREVAADLHVNESRVSQIKQRAISKLRLCLESPARGRAA